MKRMLKWVPVSAYCALIFYLISMSVPSAQAGVWVDKFFHLLMFVPLGYLLAYAYDDRQRSSARTVAIAVLTASLYGVMTEIYQMFTPDRSAEVLDALMNVAGGLLGASSFVAVRIYNDMMMRQGA